MMETVDLLAEEPVLEPDPKEQYRKLANQLLQIEDAVRLADLNTRGWEHRGLLARWESGRLLLQYRRGRRLPNRMLRKLTVELSVSASELGARMKFFEKFPTQEKLSNCIGEFRTWLAIKQKALTDTPRERRTNASLALKRTVRLLEEYEPLGYDAEDEYRLSLIAHIVGRHQQRLTALKNVEAS